MAFAIRNKTTREFVRKNSTEFHMRYVPDLNKARIYGRRCDASNSINVLTAKDNFYRKFNQELYDDLEIVELEISMKVKE